LRDNNDFSRLQDSNLSYRSNVGQQDLFEDRNFLQNDMSGTSEDDLVDDDQSAGESFRQFQYEIDIKDREIVKAAASNDKY